MATSQETTNSRCDCKSMSTRSAQVRPQSSIIRLDLMLETTDYQAVAWKNAHPSVRPSLHMRKRERTNAERSVVVLSSTLITLPIRRRPVRLSRMLRYSNGARQRIQFFRVRLTSHLRVCPSQQQRAEGKPGPDAGHRTTRPERATGRFQATCTHGSVADVVVVEGSGTCYRLDASTVIWRRCVCQGDGGTSRAQRR